MVIGGFMSSKLNLFLMGAFFVLFSSVIFAVEHIYDVSQIAAGHVHKVYAPKTVKGLQYILKSSTDRISIAGGRFSQGGHIWQNHGIVIDMKYMDAIYDLDVQEKTITLQAGATWRKVQEYIDPFNLSVKVMQSYNDFTVGGSLSVNAHGRTLADGSLIETVKSVKLLLADGSLVTASRDENHQLFKAALGGYGAIGIIVEATLYLTDNEPIEQQEVIMSLEQYPDYFKKIIKNDPRVVFHNANLDIDSFSRVSSITWVKTGKPCTIVDRLQQTPLVSFEYLAFQCARYIKAIQKMRMLIQVIKGTEKIVWRNYEMSTSVATVEPFTRSISTTVLQEYFVPCDQLLNFLDKLKNTVKEYDINMMNISLRYVHRDTESVLAYAQPEESFAVVCYINMINNRPGMHKAQSWTQKLVDYALGCGGTYYVPYQLHATKNQFSRAYPRYKELLTIKNSVDPNNRFMNTFLQKYIV